MAEDYDKLKKAVDDLEVTLYDDTKGYSLASKMADAREKYGVKSTQYLSFKRQWDAYKKEYDEKKLRLDAMDAASKKKKAAYDYTNPNGAKVKKVKEYDNAAKAAIEQNDLEAYNDAIEAGNAIRQEIASAGYTPPPIPQMIATPPAGGTTPVSPAATPQSPDGTPGSTGGKFETYTIDGDGQVKQNGKTVIFVETKDANGNTVATPYTTYAQARDAFLKQYATPDAIKTLQAQMLSAGYIKQSDIADGTWASKGVDDLLLSYTVKSVSDVKYGGLSEPIGLANFLKIKKVGGGTGGGPSKYQIITTRGDAKKMLNEYLTDLIGRNSTPEEEEEFYKRLHDKEGKAVQTSNNGVVTGSVMTEAERLVIAANVARKSLVGTNLDSILKSSKGSQVSIDIGKLQAIAADYGVPMTAAEALKYVSAGLGQQDYLKKQEERIKLVAKQLNPALASHIDAGGTVKDIADVYGLAKSTKLGTIVTDSTYDKDVMDAVTKNMSLADFERQLQKRPEWRTTEEAHKVANDFASTILKSFGFGG